MYLYRIGVSNDSIAFSLTRVLHNFLKSALKSSLMLSGAHKRKERLAAKRESAARARPRNFHIKKFLASGRLPVGSF